MKIHLMLYWERSTWHDFHYSAIQFVHLESSSFSLLVLRRVGRTLSRHFLHRDRRLSRRVSFYAC